MDKIEQELPFKLTLTSIAVFVVAVAGAVFIAKKIPFVSRLV